MLTFPSFGMTSLGKGICSQLMLNLYPYPLGSLKKQSYIPLFPLIENNPGFI
jgi:hypothetical protein